MPRKAAPPPPPPNVDDLVARRELWPVHEAAYRLGVSTKTLYRRRDRGEIAIVILGNRAFVTEAELRRYVDATDNGARRRRTS